MISVGTFIYMLNFQWGFTVLHFGWNGTSQCFKKLNVIHAALVDTTQVDVKHVTCEPTRMDRNKLERPS